MKPSMADHGYIKSLKQHVAEAATEDFRELLKITELDPTKDLRFMDWSGVDFSGCDLSGCDFTGANLMGCQFKDAKLFKGMSEVKIVDALKRETAEAANFHRAQLDRNSLRRALGWKSFIRPFRVHDSTKLCDAHLPDFALFSDAPFAPEMVVLPVGEFWMGSTPDEQERFEISEHMRKWESPRHLVRIDQAFAMGRYPVTFEEYDAYCEVRSLEKPDDKEWSRGRRPVVNVSHDDATKYCAWLSERTGAEYRLPSESEWEYACRAGTDTAYWWGDAWEKKRANGCADIGKTTEVGTFDPNPWNLCDTHGNVLEWCADGFERSYEVPRSQTPFNTIEGSGQRVLRGGSWDDYPRYLRSASRRRNEPDGRFRSIGFRLARTLTP